MTNSPPAARLLDVSRLISRAGHTQTGIDRVEQAYLKAFIASEVPVWGLIKTRLGFLLLDQTGLVAFSAKLDETNAQGRSTPPSDPHRMMLGEARKLAVGRALRPWLGRMLKAKLPSRTTYFNTGHTNFTDYVTRGINAIEGGRIVVFLHDTIPLDLPQFQRPETVANFARFLARVSAKADLVIYNSQATQDDARPHLEELGRVPNGFVAHLGVENTPADSSGLPAGMPPQKPYFVCVGTLEPRKNHAFLLTVWQQLAEQLRPEEMPELLICGRRGWLNDALFAKLDDPQLRGAHVHELSDLDDGAISALLEGSAGALFPSLAEGYGLPVMEAAMRGIPVICPELPVYREIMKDIPVYASVNDSYLWSRRITALAEQKKAGQQVEARRYTAPTWNAHFNLVLSVS